AVDRFDPDRGVELSSYATPLILGEIRQHFRDRAGAVRVPRRLVELGAEIGPAREELSQQLGRSPTVAEVARHLQRDEESVLEALEARRARICEPLHADRDDVDANAYGRNGSGQTKSHYVHGSGLLDADGHDTALDLVDDRETLRPLLSQLSPRDKHVLALRLLRGASQSEIAAELGISQMHVSRILHRLVSQLTTSLVDAG
ncbi:MAG TPA: sigma-70 family RNA polymerase sigma factor, partial [Actinomycetales bacterium]